jgi:RNA polymerase sigma-70 factor (ECF subfamily)
MISLQDEVRIAASPALSERELVLRAQRRDEEAFAILAERYRSRVRAKIVAILRDDDAAEDACQETWVQVLRDLPDLRDPGAFASWLLTTAANVAKQQLRSRPTRMAELLPEGQPDPRDGFNAAELRTDLSSLIRELSPRTSALAELHYLKDLDQEAIADKLELPLGTVSGTLARARRELKFKVERRQQRDAERLRQRMRFSTRGALNLYCPMCGRHRMEWRSAVLPFGSERIETFCPDCCRDGSLPVTQWMVPRQLGRTWDEEAHLAQHRVLLSRAREVVKGHGLCPACSGRLIYLPSFVSRFERRATEARIAWRCAECEYRAEGRLGALIVGDAAVQRFWREYALFLPADGEQVSSRTSREYRVSYVDLRSRIRLIVTVDVSSLRLTSIDLECGGRGIASS